ncbi:hypothetical protein [Microbacterium sp. NPDC055455]
MDPFVLFLLPLLKGIGDRVVDEISGHAFDSLKSLGVAAFQRLVRASRDDDAEELAASAHELSIALQDTPAERQALVSATISATRPEPLMQMSSVLQLMWSAASTIDLVPRGSRPAGALALAGSFPDRAFVTVYDVRDLDRAVNALADPLINQWDEPTIYFSDLGGQSEYWTPRMWVLRPGDSVDARGLAKSLNTLLHDKRKQPDPMLVELELCEFSGVDQKWRVSYLHGDRLLAKTLSGPASGGRPDTELDVADAAGTLELLESLSALTRSQNERDEVWSKAWNEISVRVGENPDDR